jgi:sialate O-acetylesterase
MSIRATEIRLFPVFLALVLAAACVALLSRPAGVVNISLPTFFADGMVLQRNKPNAIWGKATPSEALTLTLKKGDLITACVKTTADSNGSWRTELPAFSSVGQYSLVIQGVSKVEIHNILFGDVFLLIGQSNLIMPLGKTDKFQAVPTEQQIAQYRWFQVEPVSYEMLPSKPRCTVSGSWHTISKGSLDQIPAVPYYFGQELSKKSTVPVGLIISGFGGTPILPWIPPDTWFLRKKLGGWTASTVFNAMLSPLVGYSVKGVIWYQGEGDLFTADRYTADLSTFVRAVRRLWHDQQLPFFITQLTAFGQRSKLPEDSSWAQIRESQLKVSAEENATLVVTCDTARDLEPEIHPDHKFELGKRLADTVFSSLYEGETVGQPKVEIEIQGSKILLRLANRMSSKDGRLDGFAIAGTDKHFLQASAELNPDGKSMTLWNDHLAEPKEVRYAWANNPVCSIFDAKTGFPLAPFRTDHWRIAPNNSNLEKYIGSQMVQRVSTNR